MQTTNHTANLDCLRALAVLAVAGSHAYIWHLTLHAEPRGIILATIVGRAGVLAFFVHTSLVLMWSLLRIPSSARTAAFYIRRAFRIYPLSILTVLAVLLFKIPDDPHLGSSFHRFPNITIAANLLLVQDLISHRAVLSPLWSLPLEVQMYLFLPFLFLVAVKPRSGRTILALWFLFLVLGILLQIWTGDSNLGFVPCFLGGVYAFASRSDRSPKIPALLWPLALLIWSRMILQFYGNPPRDIVVNSIACLALGAAIPLFEDSRSRTFNAITATIAKYSYGIYLSHIPVLWALHRVWTPQHEFLGYVLWACGTALTSFLLFHLVEDPMIRLGKRLAASLLQHRTTAPAEA